MQEARPVSGEAPDRAPRWARPFVYGFLVLFVVCACAGFADRGAWHDFEPRPWPLSGWRLFSETRTSTARTFEAFTVDGRGRERPLDTSRLDIGPGDFRTLLPRLGQLSGGRRDELCRTWADSAAENRAPVAALRIYAVTRAVPRRRSTDPPVLQRRLRWECGRQ